MTAITSLPSHLNFLRTSLPDISRDLASNTRLQKKALVVLLALPPLVVLVRRARASYNAYLALGPGGLPYNIFGWALTTSSVPFALSREQACSPAAFDGIIARVAPPSEPLNLPVRDGKRPLCSAVIPQRQLDQQASPELKATLDAVVDDVYRAFEPKLEKRLSGAEKHTDALWVAATVMQEKGAAGLLPAAVKYSKGEIGHVHGEGSSHWHLHPMDAQEIVAKGWGERHLFSQDNWIGRGAGVSAAYIMVYAMKEDEIKLFREVVERSVKWMLGEL